mmetsp:Transcript_58377/g.126268  ORF Transcript_58377/g.126268 Transcript_58377/m.126268 type:complete len:288 (-) Transcript_58377:276-1139(-)|eukprot:CAMPEP_0170603088 /NCGR_PEP_ID=MMETSP0224-20130122/18731_1 /TAXON_ID=285029 /ORGANISM="Togula jolla, Strain CCCM 725" /LENGTH=287 /DNA_ID=CAMNT_0010927957 /DNA_START=98 /DNA_END=961 /DNA_ORIENTATION=-
MELVDLEFGLKATASAGHVLNYQEFAGVQSGLAVLKSKERFQELFFWGKIFGQKADYYISYGLRGSEFEFPSKTFYYSVEDFDFKILERLTEEVAERILNLGVDKPFSGIPDAPLEPPGDEDAAEAEEAAEGEEGAPVPEKPRVLTEMDRLAQVVQEIDFDTAVVPNGAHALNEAHVIVPSSDFKGLGLSEALALDRYVHFRPPTSVASLKALARTDIQFYSNFLDPLEGDLPKGCWAVRQDPCIALVTLRSLNWPGYVAFHVPLTTKFGGAYFGYALKNRDLPFIL